MASATLTDARVRALNPRNTGRDIRDGKLKGFGVRVMPSGAKRWFVHCQHDGRRVWKIVGDAAAMCADKARARAAATLAAIRQESPLPASPEATVFEAVAEATFRRHERIWKPRTTAGEPRLPAQVRSCPVSPAARSRRSRGRTS